MTADRAAEQATSEQTKGSTTMRAVVQDVYGPTEDVLRLEQIPRPAIGAGDVLVKVAAAGVDRGVWHLMAGEPYAIRLAGFGVRVPKNRVRGSEFAGRVAAVGADVTTLPLATVQDLAANRQLLVDRRFTLAVNYVAMTVAGPLRSAEARQALCWAFPYDDVIDGVYAGFAKRAVGPVARGARSPCRRNGN